jgi:broad specificity phosphatase PhoE
MNKNNFCTFYIVRHGETDWNAEHIVQGITDTNLNTQGENQALELANKLKEIVFYKVYSSDLLRAKRTAEIIALEKKLAVETTQALRERRFGKFEGKRTSELKEIDDIIEKLDKERQLSYTHGGEIESDDELLAKLIPFIREIAVASPGQTILLVTHGGVIRALLRHLGLEENLSLNIPNLSYVKILTDGVEIKIEEMFGIQKK